MCVSPSVCVCIKVMEVWTVRVCEWLVSWFFRLCSETSVCVCQYVTLCDCMTVAKWEVCGVEMALMELELVHNRQDISSETRE